MSEWNKLQSTIKVFGVLASIFVIALTLYTFKAMNFIGSAPISNTITVSGHGESFAKPDIATLNFTVEKTAKTVADAQSQVTTVTNDVLSGLKNSGIAEKDIRTTSYDINPKYEYQRSACTEGFCPPSKQVLVGYTVSNTIEVKIRAIDAAGEIVGLLGQKNITNLSNLTLMVEDDSKIKTEARNQAIDRAKEQAESIAKGLGVRLVRITSFNENNYGQPMYLSREKMMAGAADSSVAPSIPVGENKSSSDVTITYEIQ